MRGQVLGNFLQRFVHSIETSYHPAQIQQLRYLHCLSLFQIQIDSLYPSSPVNILFIDFKLKGRQKYRPLFIY